MKNHLLTIFFLAAFFEQVFAQQAPIVLYPDGVPNSKSSSSAYAESNENNIIRLVTNPVIIPFIPAKANGTAVIICPGGGYEALMMKNEGVEVARKFNEAGIAAFVLKYRLPSDRIMQDKTIGPLQDVQRAIQLVRQKASEWNVNPAMVGVIGFSAGGHLASSAGTHFQNPVIAPAGNLNLRPDFMMLIYPVITFGEAGHRGSARNLLGDQPDQTQLDLYSNEKQVGPNTPVTFIVQAQDDKTVSIQNSLLFYNALLKANVKTEMLLYPGGGHGFGLNNKTTKDDWFDHALNWLESSGFLIR